jgi:hypothetical protein
VCGTVEVSSLGLRSWTIKFCDFQPLESLAIMAIESNQSSQETIYLCLHLL